MAQVIDMLHDADLLVTTGGASVGDHDLVQAGLQRRGFVRDFWQIAMRPGKPLMFGRVKGTPVIGMPGNPVSALVCALLFVRSAIWTLLGRSDIDPRFERIILGAPLPSNDKREDYIRAYIERGSDGKFVATALGAQDSSMLFMLARATGLIRRRPFAVQAEAGEHAEAIIFDHACSLF
jgi:molybdopterin molybdotransferase